MRLKSLSYAQFKNDPREWDFQYLALKDINLIVGKNAVGKSKVLNVINGLSFLLSSGTRLGFQEGDYDARFDNDGQELHYILEYHERKVVREEFRRGGEELLIRGEGGVGRIFAEKETKSIEFQTPQDEIAVVARRDSLQHSYLEPLYQWASKVLFYHFGTSLGRENLVLFGPGTGMEATTVDLRNENAVVGIYHYGYERFGEPFDRAIQEDMKAIGHELTDVGSRALATVKVSIGNQIDATAVGLAVQEKDLPAVTEQQDISTGMFRALSLFVQLNCAFMQRYPTLILVDDIGEGLDYERSCLLIERLMSKAVGKGVQLVMSTNDRFVMNSVPLEYWSILQRTGGHVKVFNYENSKQIFDDFKFSGLNNFDFFAYDYLNEENEEEEVNVEAGNLC